MIITTAQEAALVSACCPCQPPEAPAPRRECQSISVGACGESLPSHPDVPAEVRCLIFKKITHSFFSSQSVDTPYSGGGSVGRYVSSRTINWSCSQQFVYTGDDIESRACASTLTASFSDSSDYTITLDGEEDEEGEVFETGTFNESGTGTETTWVGTYNQTQSFPSSPPPSSASGSIPYPGCPFVTFMGEGHVYADLGSSKTTVTSLYDGIEGFDDYSDVTTETFSVTYSEPVELADIIAEIAARAALLGSDPWPGTACQSEAVYSYGYPDPELDEEGDPIPPEPDAPAPEPVCQQVSSATKARYRIGIPSGDVWKATTDAWIAWDEADPDERGEEPPKTSYDEALALWTDADPETRGPEPIPRTYYAWQGDEVFFPAAWEAWKALSDAYAAAVAAHEAWEDADPDDRGDEPEIPEDPGAAPTPGPSLVASRSWTYSGADEWSPWWEIAIPETAGETRLVNQLARHYRSARLGNKPTAFGKTYAL
jgi:hypothetical protein